MRNTACCQGRPYLAQAWPKLGRRQRNIARNRQNLSRCSANVEQSRTEFGQTWPKSDAKIGQFWTKLGRLRSNQIWPTSTKLSQCRPVLATVWPKLDQIWCNSAEFDQIWAEFGQICSSSTQVVLSLAKFDQIWDHFRRNWGRNSTNIGGIVIEIWDSQVRKANSS